MAEQGPPIVTALAPVGVGGFAGAIVRHGATIALPTSALGTLAVNVLGSFLLSLVLSESVLAQRLSSRLRLVVATGFLSSFTTYSTFALATTALPPMAAAGYVGVNYGLAIGAVVVAHALAGWRS
jgi:CrcB protein